LTLGFNIGKVLLAISNAVPVRIFWARLKSRYNMNVLRRSARKLRAKDEGGKKKK